MNEWIASVLLIAGTGFILLSAVGMLRFPDLYTRMQATTKASSMGILLMLFAICIAIPVLPVWIKSFLAIVYIFSTTPVASHTIGRAGHLMGLPKWRKTHTDDLEKEMADSDPKQL